jgi:hypothetical protein
MTEHPLKSRDRGAHDYFLNVPDTNWPALETRATWPANHDDDSARTLAHPRPTLPPSSGLGRGALISLLSH